MQLRELSSVKETHDQHPVAVLLHEKHVAAFLDSAIAGLKRVAWARDTRHLCGTLRRALQPINVSYRGSLSPALFTVRGDLEKIRLSAT